MGHKPVGVAVIGAGYWGPNLVRNFLGAPPPSCAGCATSTSRGPGRWSGARQRGAVTTDLDEVLADPERRGGRDRHPGRAPTAAWRSPRSRAGKHVLMEKPLATTRGRGRAAGRGRRRTRPGADVRPHLLLHAGGPRIRARWCTAASSASSSTSTRCASTWASSSPTSTCSGTWRRTTCRSSTSCCPADRQPVAVAAHGADPIGAGPGLRRLPHAAPRAAARSPTSTSTG